jgi:hypothetical protein
MSSASTTGRHDSDQHTEFTSKLYSIVQQKTDPKLQKNTRERERT